MEAIWSDCHLQRKIPGDFLPNLLIGTESVSLLQRPWGTLQKGHSGPGDNPGQVPVMTGRSAERGTGVECAGLGCGQLSGWFAFLLTTVWLGTGSVVPCFSLPAVTRVSDLAG